jgi:hypothetical protein
MKRILEVQKEIGNLSKSSKNPFFKSAYLDLNDLLNAVHPLLHEKDLSLVQPIIDGQVHSTIIDCETGKALISSSILLPDIKDPQKLGSCITYYRRYTLKSLLAIAEKDDDGNEASKPEPRRLSKDQFEKAQTCDKKQIKAILDKFEMSEIQRNTLEILL